MQNPNEDTEWNDVLRAKGILPAKPKEAEVTEEAEEKTPNPKGPQAKRRRMSSASIKKAAQKEAMAKDI